MSRSQPPVVYLLEDDEQAREALANTLLWAGHTPRCFGRPSAFLEQCSPRQPGAVVMDVRLPEMSGLEVQRELQQRGITLPVLLISHHADVPMVVQAMRQGAFDFMQKPLDERKLLERVGAALSVDAQHRSRMQRIAQSQALYQTLSPREKQVMQLVVEGRPNKVIAHLLGLSERTVEVHRSNLMEKMQAQSVPHLVHLHMLAMAVESASD